MVCKLCVGGNNNTKNKSSSCILCEP